jgi:hypothetical protein
MWNFFQTAKERGGTFHSLVLIWLSCNVWIDCECKMHFKYSVLQLIRDCLGQKNAKEKRYVILIYMILSNRTSHFGTTILMNCNTYPL